MNVLLSVPHHFDAEREYPWFNFVTENPTAWVPNPHKQITKHHLLEMPNLKVISTPSTGVTHIPMGLCDKYGIKVLALTDDRESLNEIKASSEFAFMLVLMALKNVHIGLTAVRAGKWHDDEDLLRGNELYEKTVGIVGFGRIGQNVAKWCRMMGCATIYSDPAFSNSITIENIFKLSDIILVSCALNDSTVALIGKRLLLSMKENACLVNVSRGQVIDEKEIVETLVKRPDLRLAVDVVTDYQHRRTTHPFLRFPRQVMITPHMAGTTYESQEKAARTALYLLRKYGRR